jgi:hypothetical protein
MLAYSATSHAAPADAWALVSRPGEWHRWAPHLRGAVGLGRPEVERGRIGVGLLAGVVPVPSAVVAKEAGRSWTWQVGLLRVRHAVRPLGSGCEVRMELSAPGPLEALVGVSYGPVVALLVRRLARIAEGV